MKIVHTEEESESLPTTRSDEEQLLDIVRQVSTAGLVGETVGKMCLFTAEVEEPGGTAVIEVPQREVETDEVEEGAVHRVAILSSRTKATPETTWTSERGRRAKRDSPPVEEGDLEEVEAEDIGDKGDGIARVGAGYVVIVPGTDIGDRLAIEITEARENMAFAEIVDRFS